MCYILKKQAKSNSSKRRALDELGGKFVRDTVKKVSLDYEWVVLIRRAKTMGITTEEIRDFLKKAKKEDKHDH